MSKLIPSFLNTTPPPIGITDADDNDDDEFGDFSTAEGSAYGCDSCSIPHSPEDLPRKRCMLFNSNTTNFSKNQSQQHADMSIDEETKDYQDKRKNTENLGESLSPNVTLETSVPTIVHNKLLEEGNCIQTDEHILKDICKDDLSKNDLDVACPPQLFDDDSDEKEDISGTPSNFSISLDDNVIDDEEDVSENIPTELPNCKDDVGNYCIDINCEKHIVDHLERKPESLITFHDSDFEEKQINEIVTNEINEISDKLTAVCNKFEDCAQHNKSNENKEGDNSVNQLHVPDEVNIVSSAETVPVSCDTESNSNKFNNLCVNTGLIFPVERNIDLIKDDTECEAFSDDNNTQCTNQRSMLIPSSQTTEQISNALNEDDAFDGFANFSSALVEFVSQIPETVEPNHMFRHMNMAEGVIENTKGKDTDFDGNTTSMETKTLPMAKTESLLKHNKVFEETQTILKVMYKPVALEEVDCKYTDATLTSPVFHHIKDVTDTHALSYQWGKSQVQQALFKTLNIDTRNILHGHGVTMPKFAATLCTLPLEPVKSGIMMASQASVNASDDTLVPPIAPNHGLLQALTDRQIPQENCSIPTAQFDWVASGMANPLDSISNYELKATMSNTQVANDIKVEEATIFQKRHNHDTESVNSLQFPEIVDVDESKSDTLENCDEFSDFTSFQATCPHKPDHEAATWSTSNMIPLRETYISDVKSNSSDLVIQNLLASRKSSSENMEGQEQQQTADDVNEISVPPPNDNQINSEWLTQSSREETEDDFAEFQDFQTSSATHEVKKELPELTKPGAINALDGSVPGSVLLPPVLLEPIKLTSSPMVPQEILWPEPGITNEELARFDLYAQQDGNYNSTVSSMSTASTISKPVKSCTRPNDPNNGSVCKAPETKLSGTGGALMVEKHVVVPANKVILPFNEVLLPPNNQVLISKDLVLPILESSPRKYIPQQKALVAPVVSLVGQATPTPRNNDEWGDFISTQASPGGLSGSSILPNEQILSSASTAELSLSIPQLRSMQSINPPSKPPIPVITSRGLMQTKIPSMAPNTPTKFLPQTTLHVQPPADGYQPAIISTQFAAQLNMNIKQTTFSDFFQMGHCPTTSIPVNLPDNNIANERQSEAKQCTQKKVTGLHDEDEWSDFMSSQPLKTENRGVCAPTSSIATLQSGDLTSSLPVFGNDSKSQALAQMRTDWNLNGYPTELPNIITNPVHFERYPTNIPPVNAMNKRLAATNCIFYSTTSKKSQNLNVARLPDLDFVAPKGKVLHNKK